MSFGDPRLSPPSLPMRVTRVRVEVHFSQSSLFLFALSPCPLPSCHSDPFQSHAAARTSLPGPFPAPPAAFITTSLRKSSAFIVVRLSYSLTQTQIASLAMSVCVTSYYLCVIFWFTHVFPVTNLTAKWFRDLHLIGFCLSKLFVLLIMLLFYN